MYARERTGEGGVVLYVLSSVSLYACVCERLFLSVVMTVVLGLRCFDSLSKHKRMWLGWRQGGMDLLPLTSRMNLGGGQF